MSRVLKFRAWDDKQKRMYYPYPAGLYTENNDFGYPTVIHELAVEDAGRCCKEGFHDNGAQVILQQFTGLRDEHGTEIYEGDIISYAFNGDQIGTIEFASYDDNEGVNHQGFRVKWKHWPEFDNGFGKDTVQDMRVIGNIFENYQLIE